MNKPYPYASGNLLDDRNTYFYSAYGGIRFLHAWASDRDDSFTTPALPPPAEKATEVPAAGSRIETAILFECLLNAMANDATPNALTIEWLSKLVKKFEVTKRIHHAYDENFKAINRENHRDLALYLRLAEVFEKAFSITSALPYLNALLKTLDTMCALRDDMSEHQRARLSGLIERERIHVIKIADRMGVPSIA